MVPIVVPFRGQDGKTRLGDEELREKLALAMLGDVLAACTASGHTILVTPDDMGREAAAEAGADVVFDPGQGQGAAVRAALRHLGEGPALVVNADVPCVVPRDLRTLAAATELGAFVLVESEDGTTNALGLPRAELFAPLYGAGSADRFRAHAAAQGIDVVSAAIPNLADDVDTLADLARVGLRAGPRTQAAISLIRGG
jgi:2-phospho-L-lactate guanylyltransferase